MVTLARCPGDPTAANTPIHLFRPGCPWTVEESSTSACPAATSWIQGVAHLIDCVVNDTEPVNNALHARHVLDIMLTAARSAKDRADARATDHFSRPTRCT